MHLTGLTGDMMVPRKLAFAVAVVAVLVGTTWTSHAQDEDEAPVEDVADDATDVDAEAGAADAEADAADADAAGEAGDGAATQPVERVVTPINPLSLKWLTRRLESVSSRSKQIRAKVDLLKDAVLRGGGSAQATVVHLNQMGSQFRLVQLSYTIDGTQVFSQRDAEGSLYDKKRIDILSGPIAPGNHTISVVMVYRGHGYGPFKYLNKQEFTVRGSKTFTTVEGLGVAVDVLGFERKNVPLEQRPTVSFKISKPEKN